MEIKNQKYILSFVILALLIGFNIFLDIGKCGLFDVDEAVYSEVSREMAATGDYIVPHFNGKPFLEKPAFFYWMQAISFKIFGVGEVQARLPSASVSLLLLAGIFLLARNIFGNIAALFACTALAFNIEMGVLSKAATTDAFLLFFISMSVLCFLTGMFAGKRRYYYGFYACAALAGLVKGPVGFVIPFAVVILSAALSGQLKELKNAKPVTGLLLFIVILIPWYVAVSAATHGDFLREFFLKQNIARFGKPLEGHSGIILYYIPVILFGFFPWSAFLFSAFGKMGFGDKKNIYLIVWAALPFLIFSFSGTKLPNYIFPVFTPLAIITGLWFEKYYLTNEKASSSSFLLIFLALAISAFLFFSDSIIKIVQLKFDNPFLRQNILSGKETRIFAIVFLAFTSISAVFAAKGFKKAFISFVAGSGLLLNLFAVIYLIPKSWIYIQGGLYELSMEARTMKCNLITYGIYNPSINFYSHKLTEIVAKDGAGTLSKRKDFCLIADDSLAESFPKGLVNVKSVPGYVLLRTRTISRPSIAYPAEQWHGLYGVLRRTDLRMFFIINKYPGYYITDYIMMFFTTLGTGLLILPAALILYFYDRKNFGFNLTFLFIVVLAGGVIVQVLKFIINSPRPLKRLNDVRVLLGPLREHGFPSGHTQAAFSVAFFLSAKIRKWAIAFFICAFIVGYSRIYVGAHFPSDVFAGACVGIVTAGILMILFEDKLKRKFEKNL